MAVPFSLLQENGVSKAYHLVDGPSISNSREGRLLFIARPTTLNVARIVQQIHNDTALRISREYIVAFSPRLTSIMQQELEAEGLADIIDTRSVNFGFIPVDNDVLLLGHPNAAAECVLDADTSVTTEISLALADLESIVGPFRELKSKGPVSGSIISQFLRLQEEKGSVDSNSSSTRDSNMHAVFSIDRHIDLITPMLTPLTYEGLVDEVMGIKNCMVTIESAGLQSQLLLQGPVTSNQPSSHQATGSSSNQFNIPLVSDDPLFAEIRNMHFSTVQTQVLTAKARALQQNVQKSTQLRDSNLTDLKTFVSTDLPVIINSKSSLENHITVTTAVHEAAQVPSFQKRLALEADILEGAPFKTYKDVIEDLIVQGCRLQHVLRILCLLSAVKGGVKASRLDSLLRSLLHTYNYDSVFSLYNLEKAGLLLRTSDHGDLNSDPSPVYLDFAKSRLGGSSAGWSKLKDKLRLMGDVDPDSPTDITYIHAFAGYAPLSIRLLQAHLNLNGFKPSDDVIYPPVVVSRSANARGQRHRSIVVVVFPGGLTYSEIAALRYLNQLEGCPHHFVVAATAIINGSTFISEFLAQ
eukprot:GILK01008817.1.p1 GENE.GILK01008817.1~~GILK01008817.1.p1  ORF type:complete len:639 (+),score=119.90 GILK01008817.1:173-1918(+)